MELGPWQNLKVKSFLHTTIITEIDTFNLKNFKDFSPSFKISYLATSV